MFNMIQQNFKKDSRVWLHKNSKRKPPRHEKVNFCSGQRREFYKNPFDDDEDDCSPPITGADGRVYKKDSRSWLHKSSARNTSKVVVGDGGHKTNGVKNHRRMWDIVKSAKLFSGGEKFQGNPIVAKDSGMIRQQHGLPNGGKRKKNASRWPGRIGLTSISHIQMVQELDENSIFTHTNPYDKGVRIRCGKGSLSDNDNTYEESSSDSDPCNDNAGDDIKQRVMKRLCESPTHRNPLQNRYDSHTCRSNTDAAEITQDGLSALREIAREMQLQPGRRRSSYIMDHSDQSITPNEHQDPNRQDVSPTGLSSSLSSLNVCVVNLSDECINDQCDNIPPGESEYQLNKATNVVQSPRNNLYQHSDNDQWSG